jgi:hypothetical protein
MPFRGSPWVFAQATPKWLIAKMAMFKSMMKRFMPTSFPGMRLYENEKHPWAATGAEDFFGTPRGFRPGPQGVLKAVHRQIPGSSPFLSILDYYFTIS